jgi:pilus assembly protein Flp/PilA
MWRIRLFLSDEDGPTSVEYAVMLSMILGAVITAVSAVGGQSGGMWANVQSSLSQIGFGS